MRLTKHTPEPWKLFYRDEGPNGIDAIVSTGSYDIHIAEIKDACLIAAAPDLLKAIKALMEAANEKCVVPRRARTQFDSAGNTIPTYCKHCEAVLVGIDAINKAERG